MTHLEDLLTGEVITVSADASIDDAIRLLQQHRIRHLPVVRDDVPIGMVSQGDVLVAVGGLLSEERVSTLDPTVPYAGPTVVGEIMTPGVVMLPPEETIVAAARLMLERRIAAVVLVSNKSIVGIVTESDYLRRFFDQDTLIIPDACRRQAVADYMSRDVVTTVPTANVFELIREMGKRIHHLPVVDRGVLVGILSDHDVHRALALDKIEQITQQDQHFRLMEGFDAGRIMRTVQTTTPQATLAEAAEQMIEKGVGALAVVESGELAGIIAESDLLRACVGSLRDAS